LTDIMMFAKKLKSFFEVT